MAKVVKIVTSCRVIVDGDVLTLRPGNTLDPDSKAAKECLSAGTGIEITADPSPGPAAPVVTTKATKKKAAKKKASKK